MRTAELHSHQGRWSLGLDNSHTPVLASMLQRPALQELSAERNQLSEAGLLQLADALLAIEGGQARLTMLAVANQKGALSTLVRSSACSIQWP